MLGDVDRRVKQEWVKYYIVDTIQDVPFQRLPPLMGATFWADKVDVLRLQEAGGWSSLTMSRRYVEESEIVNEGMA